jgi:hypothetical protein
MRGVSLTRQSGRSRILSLTAVLAKRGRGGGGEIAMTIEDLQNNEVLSWRQKRLVTMGFEPEHASEIAQTTLDLYELEHLLGRGCPPHTAVAILR